MGRREIIISALLAGLGLGGTSAVAGMTSTASIYTPYLLGLGWAAVLGSFVGLAVMFRNAPKAMIATTQALIEQAPERQFLDPDITPEVLRKKTENRTSVQIDALTKTYAGKWLRVSGRVFDVTSINFHKRDSFALHVEEETRPHLPSVMVVFGEPWLDQLSAMNKGDWITCVGMIDRLQGGVTLVSGEIEHIGEPPPKKARTPRTRKPTGASGRPPA
ncbi:hypothetical protein [Brevundimonas balnearis]|uniref:Uncharacterized protein n=1 Tax=Brevundimonas balnearis TaxID=1572858 RepID=A0ABV6R1S0_9CAUL